MSIPGTDLHWWKDMACALRTFRKITSRHHGPPLWNSIQDPCRRVGDHVSFQEKGECLCRLNVNFWKRFCNSFRTPYPGPEWKTRRAQSVVFLICRITWCLSGALKFNKARIIACVIQDVNMSPKTPPLVPVKKAEAKGSVLGREDTQTSFPGQALFQVSLSTQRCPSSEAAEPTSQVELSISKETSECLLTCQIYLSGMGLRGFPDRVNVEISVQQKCFFNKPVC